MFSLANNRSPGESYKNNHLKSLEIALVTYQHGEAFIQENLPNLHKNREHLRTELAQPPVPSSVLEKALQGLESKSVPPKRQGSSSLQLPV